MTSTKINKTKYLANDKYFFASFLNMARHNIYLNIVDIAKRLDKKPPENDDQIFSPSVFGMLKDIKQPDKSLKAKDLLRRNFPFTEPLLDNYIGRKYKGKTNLADAPMEDYYDLFQLLFKTVNNLRNEYTHEYKKVSEIDPNLIKDLQKVFDAAVYLAQSRFEFVESDIDHLRRIGKNGKEKNLLNMRL